jgi:hypothetical protein
VLASLIAIPLLAPSATATVIECNGDAETDGNSPQWGDCAPVGDCSTNDVNTNDVLVWNDQHVVKNVNTPYWNPHLKYHFTVDIYRWVGGSRGAWISGASETLTAVPGTTDSNTQTVQATYTGWNGADPSNCTFEVYRTITPIAPGGAGGPWTRSVVI